MNKIYRRIWSAARKCWVVASELSSARGKRSQTMGSRIALAILVVVNPLSVFAADSMEEDVEWWGQYALSPFQMAALQPSSLDAKALHRLSVYNNTTASGWSTVTAAETMAVGAEAHAGGVESIAVGIRSKATSNNSVAVGNRAESNGAHAVSLGFGSRAQSFGTVSLGNSSRSNGLNAIALGSASAASGYAAIAVGGNSKARAEGSIVVGEQAEVANGSSKHSIAIGNLASSGGYADSIALGRSARAHGTGKAMALGAEANADHANAVALGANSATTGTNQISVGNASMKRRIVNVDDGLISASSTDAVNGRQLKVVRDEAENAQGTANAARTTASTALARADQALANTRLVTQSSASSGIRIGGENTGTVIDVANQAGAKRRVQNLANGVLSASSTDAVTGQQLNSTNADVAGVRAMATSAATKADALTGLISQASASGNVRLGGENTGTVLDARNKSNAVRSITGLKDGALSTSSTEAVTGKQLNATNGNVAAVKSTADAAQARVAVLDGLVGQVSASGNVRLGADNTGTVVDVANKAGAKRKLQNLANGVLSTSSTDAVTGQQLNATNSEVTSVRTAATAAKTAADAARGIADGAVLKADALGGLVGQVSASGNVRLGAENTGTIVDVANKTGAKRRIYNIANGTLSAGSTDAVTGQQLFATNATVETQRQVLAGHAQQLTDQDGRIADNRIELDALRADFDNFDPDLDGVVKFSADRRLVDMEGARVSGVAAGDISSAASTDAVNGGQLFATNVRVSELERKGRFLSVGYDDESIDADAGLLGVALGDSAKASLGSEGGVAIGSFAVAGAFNSVAIGRGAVVAEGAERGFALGVGSNVYAKEGVAFGALSRVVAGADGAVALGSYSIATEANTVSVGSGSVKRRLVNLDRGISDHDATTIAQLNEALAGLGGGAGLDAFGKVVGPTYSVQGGKQDNVGDALAALDGAVLRSGSRVDSLEGQLRATFQQSPSTRADGVGQLNLAGAQGMVLSNLADGRIAEGSRDAVTGSQLFAAKQDIARNRIHLEELKSRGFMEASDSAGAVDFGGSRLTGAAKGRIDGDSSDLVNGGQLHETNLRLSKVEADSAWLAVGADDQSRGAVAGALGVALGGDAVAGGTGATALGSYATAEATNSIALGRGAWVSESGFYGFAVGSGSRVNARFGVAIGAASQVLGGADGSVALGAESVADQVGTVSVGNDYLKRRIVNVANGRNTNDAATIGQLRGALSTLGGNIDANGNVTTPGFTVQGQHQSTVNDALATLDSAVVTTGSRMDRVETQLRSVFQEAPSIRSDGTAQLTLAGANGMVISNVANGLIAAGSREAVNGGQLHAVQQQLNGRMDGLEQRVDGQPQSRALATASAAPTEQVTPTPEASNSPQVASAGEGTSPAPQPKSKKDDTPSPTPQVDTAELEKMLARANEYTDGAISNFERRLDKMDKRFNRMAAMSSAQTAMAMNTAGLATYNRLGAGVGYAEGESAMAVGYQRVLNEKGSATFSLNGAFTNSGERSMGVGVGIGW